MSNQPDAATASVIGRGRSPYDQWLLGRTGAIRKIARHVERAAEVQCSVLIVGETGTGKELFARLLHSTGPRVDKPFVPVNCAALTATLAESQLFGHERAHSPAPRVGRWACFERPRAESSFSTKSAKCRWNCSPSCCACCEEREVTPVGAAQPAIVDVQVIAATNRNLEADVASGQFREDLYYRLNMVELQVPALRDRRDDIPDFIDFFAAKFAERYDRPRWRPDPETLRQFCEFAWPGNIRQLSQVIEQGYVLDCPPALPRPSGLTEETQELPFTDLSRLRYVAVHQALKATRGHKGRAARMLGVHPNTLTRILAQMSRDGELPATDD